MTTPSSPGEQFPQYPGGSAYPEGSQYPSGPGPTPMPPPYGGYPGGPPAQPQGTNVMAILAIVFAFVFSPLAIVFGIIGRKQTKQRGEGGRGLATAGLILGIVFTVLAIGFGVLIGVVAANATPTVTQANVESQISSQLAAKVGQTPDSVSCPGDLKGKVGTVMTCTLTANGDTHPVDVTVTSVDGLTVHFDIEVK